VDCEECGAYNICDYCYQDYIEKNDSESIEEEKKPEITCVFCWSKKTLTDM